MQSLRSAIVNYVDGTKSRYFGLRASCDTCTLAKVKCSKTRPSCARCLTRGGGCTYSPVSRVEKLKSNAVAGQESGGTWILPPSPSTSRSMEISTLYQLQGPEAKAAISQDAEPVIWGSSIWSLSSNVATLPTEPSLLELPMMEHQRRRHQRGRPRHTPTPSNSSVESSGSVSTCLSLSTVDNFEYCGFDDPTIGQKKLSIARLSFGGPLEVQTLPKSKLSSTPIHFSLPAIDSRPTTINPHIHTQDVVHTLHPSIKNIKNDEATIEFQSHSSGNRVLPLNPTAAGCYSGPSKLEAGSDLDSPSKQESTDPDGENIGFARRVIPPSRGGEDPDTTSARPSTEQPGSPSSSWEVETDWDEDESSYSDKSGILGALSHVQNHQKDNSQSTLTEPLLISARQRLVERIMQDFWNIFGDDWASHVRSCAGSTSASESQQSSSSGSLSSSKCVEGGLARPGKRARDKEQDDWPEDEEPFNPEPFKKEALDLHKSNLKFACPYRKNNPRKYCVQGIWRSCALTPLDSIARVKAHLYRHHRVYQCRRCKTEFNNSEEVDVHLQAIRGCDLVLGEEAEGITEHIEKRLRSRKKTGINQTAEERWKEIYHLIFPGEPMQEPYFEPVQEDIYQLPDVELFLYEEYSRRELPRMFRAAIENIVNEGTSQLEEELRSRLTSIIQECQDQMFSNYQQRQPSTSLSLVPAEAPRPPEIVASDPDNQNPDLDDLARFYQRPPPPQSNVMELVVSPTDKSAHKPHGSADSGYASEVSAILSTQNSSTIDFSRRQAISEPAVPLPKFSWPQHDMNGDAVCPQGEQGLQNGYVDTWMGSDAAAFGDRVGNPDFLAWDETSMQEIAFMDSNSHT